MTKLLLMYGRSRPSDEHLANLLALDPSLEIMAAGSREEAAGQAVDADVFIGHTYLRQTLPVAEKVQWIQTLIAGVDTLASSALFSRGPILTRCPIFSDVIAQHAVTIAYATVRRIPEVAQMQAKGLSRRPPTLLPTPCKAMILGIGAIGLEIAAILRGLGLDVTGVATSQSAEKEAAVDQLIIDDTWRDRLQGMDLLFVTLPRSKDTINMIDSAVLQALPRHAVLVNVGRGETVDTAALVAQLRAGQLGGAALDVIEPGPDSPDDPVWQTPHLLISPHMASFTPDRQDRIERFVEGQVARFLTGEPLLYPVNLSQLAAESTRQ